MPQVKTGADLYGLPLDEFTQQRNELAKRLKAVGEKDEAARVAKLRKPSTAAWAVNQLVRTQPRRIEALFAAGDQLAKAQSQGLADQLREAAAAQREELAAIVGRAEGLLDSEGRPLAGGVLERVSETLRAAAIDHESRAQVEGGCLTRELQFTGLGGFAAGATPAQDRQDDATQRKLDREIKTAREQEQQAKQDLKEAQKELHQEERELAMAQRARDHGAEKVDRAEARLAEAAQQLDQLQRGGR